MEQWVAANHAAGIGGLLADADAESDYQRLLAIAEQVEGCVVALVEEKRASRHRGNDVLSILLSARDQEQQPISDQELIGQASVLYGAAHLTTTNALVWTTFLLAQHPQVASALVDEIAGVLGGEAPRLEQLDQMPLLERVVRESLRVLSPSVYSQRVVSAPVQLGPLSLGRGALVIFSQFITHHLPDLYADPERFRPDRWLEIAPSPYAYLPFGAGSRMCLGTTLATVVIKMTLATLLQRFRLSVVPGSRIDARVQSTMLMPSAEVPMRVHRPDGAFVSVPVTGNIHQLVELPEPIRDRLAS
jgi:cytochrome P450